MHQSEAKKQIEELEITRLIFDRMKREQCLDELERETVAYRIAEIMVTAKQMYTQILPRLINAAGESENAMEDDLAGLQMSFLHLCDLMYEFQAALLQGMKVPPPETEEAAAGLDGKEL